MKEATDAKKKKRAEKARRRHENEKEIARRVWAGENRSDVEAELESEEPMEMGGDASTSNDEGDRGVITTSVERRELAAASAGGGRDAERRGDVPALRKRTVSLDAAVEREAKRSRSPRTLGSSLASPPCSERGGARRSVGGACSYPRVFGVSART